MKNELKISNPTFKDYCKMYNAMLKLGYDPSKDIHSQFCEKYNLPYKNRTLKQKNHYSYQDCLEGKKRTNPPTD